MLLASSMLRAGVTAVLRLTRIDSSIAPLQAQEKHWELCAGACLACRNESRLGGKAARRPDSHIIDLSRLAWQGVCDTYELGNRPALDNIGTIISNPFIRLSICPDEPPVLVKMACQYTLINLAPIPQLVASTPCSRHEVMFDVLSYAFPVSE